MLYMPMMDLQQHLKQELLANPFLELLEPEEEQHGGEDRRSRRRRRPRRTTRSTGRRSCSTASRSAGQREQFEQPEYIEPVTVETHGPRSTTCASSSSMIELTPRQRLLGEEFLGNIERRRLPRRVARGDPGLGQPGASRRTSPATATAKTGSTSGRRGRRRRGAAGRPGRRRRRSTRWPRSRRCSRSSSSSTRRASAPATCASACCSSCGTRRDTDSLTYRLVHEAFPDLIAHRWNDLAKRFGVEPARGAGRRRRAGPVRSQARASSTPTAATATSFPT